MTQRITSREEKKRIEADKRMAALRAQYLPETENSVPGSELANIKNRLEYLREQIEGECISWGEIAELQSLAEYIDKDDVQLLEWAGVCPEYLEPVLPDESGLCSLCGKHSA